MERIKRNLFIILLFLIAGIDSFCQTVNYPNYANSNMEGHSIDKIEVTSYGTILHLTYKSHPQNLPSNCGYFSCFNINGNATLKTNTGQILSLKRCENLYMKGDGKYWASCYGGDFSYQLVFGKIDDNATLIDFQENAGTTTSYYMNGINLRRSSNSSGIGMEKSSLQLYNNTDKEIFFAYAYRDNNNSCWTSVGWYKVLAYSQYDLDLGNYSGHIYIHGKQSKLFGLSDSKWGEGNYFCIAPDDGFDIRNADKVNCEKKAAFSDKIIIGGINKWTFNP